MSLKVPACPPVFPELLSDSAWRQLCGDAVKTGDTIWDVASRLVDLVKVIPVALGELWREVATGNTSERTHKDGSTTERNERQRDLLPLPFTTASAEEGRRVDGPAHTTASRRGVAACMLLMIVCLNYEYCLGDIKKAARPLHGPPTQAQLRAIERLSWAADALSDWNPGEVAGKDWPTELSKNKVSYSGQEISTARMMTRAQIEAGLPPKGIAASIPAERYADGFVRDALMTPALALRPPDERERPNPSVKVWCEEPEWEPIVRCIHDRGIVGEIEEEEIPLVQDSRW